MVKRVISLFTKEVGGIHDAAYLLAFFTLLSQVLALVRDRLFAHYFGAGTTLDVYYAAFRIPDLIFVSIASFVSISVLVPLFLERLGKDDEGLRAFVSSIFSFFLLVIVAVCAIAFIYIPELVAVFSPGLAKGEHVRELIMLSRIMLISPILLGISNFFASVTQAFKRFVLYAVSPVLYNLGIIIGVIAFYPKFGTAGLAFGVVLGALLHLLIQVPFVSSVGFMPRLTLFTFKDVLRVSLTSLYRTIALSLSNIALAVLSALASLMTMGSIAVFNFAWNLQSVPLAIIGVSYSMAIFPTISKSAADGNGERFVADMATAAKHIIFWALPVTALFIVLRAQIVRTILGSGSFSWSDTRLVAAVLAIFSVSVVAQSLSLLFIRAYYASGRTRRPLLIDLVAALIIISTGFLYAKLFALSPMFRYFMETLLRVEDIAGTEVLMLPLAYSTGMIINMIAFWFVFGRQYRHFNKPVLFVAFQSFSAAVIIGLVTYLNLNLFNHVFDITTGLGIFLQGLCAGLIGIVAGIAVLRILKNQEITEVWRTLHHKFWKTRIVASEQEVV